MNLKEIDSVTKAVLKEASIESSSDFIMVAYELYAAFFPEMAKRIEPILSVEADNFHDEWASNVVFSEDGLYGISGSDMYDSMIAYRIVLDYFLNDDIVSKRFNMDEEDHLGWQIYKELDSKYVWCKRQLERISYLQEKAVNV